jgi:hypothetical protein
MFTAGLWLITSKLQLMWGTGQPDGGAQEGCMSARMETAGTNGRMALKLFDENCDKEMPFICQFNT